jgi:outer membrane receptor protein involved in Fe transport
MKIATSILKSLIIVSFIITWLAPRAVQGQANRSRPLSGVVVTQQNESVSGAVVIVQSSSGEQRLETDADGAFRCNVPAGAVRLRVEGKQILALEKNLGPDEPTEGIQITIDLIAPNLRESMVIRTGPVDPIIDRRNDAVYKNSLFLRDDQVFHTLDAGISAGQHEGGGKSLEIRRFGFNLDHGGVSGGLKVLVDGVGQNQATQGHGQGYLGQLKSLTPELVESVDVLNGPFSAEYGDFSGLGVVHIRLRETLPHKLTFRVQGGSFDSYRTFLGYSPQLKSDLAFVAYEGSRSDGPFLNPLRYKRDNLTGNYTRRFNDRQSLSFKLNAGRNSFFSSGQIPLDEVEAGRLDRFGFLDPDNGGRVRSTTLGASFRQESESGSLVKVDGFVSRSLFDLFSNFTFFLNDQVNRDQIQQHDSRLQEGINFQYVRPYNLLGRPALLIAGANFHENSINVGLYNTVRRSPIAITTKANAEVTNAAGYVQHGITLLDGRLHLDTGVRYDYFRFDVTDRFNSAFSGTEASARLQPKANVAYTPSSRIPLTLYFNYGRGISSQDARGVVQSDSGPKVSVTDFYQVGTLHELKRFSLTNDFFLIDRSNEQVYIPDDGSIEFKGPSRAYGFEAQGSAKINRFLTINGGFTAVGTAYFRGTSPRVYVDSAPHLVANAGLTLTGWKSFVGSLRFRSISSYRLDGEDASIRASGLAVVDLNIRRRLGRWIDLNVAVDNLTNRSYYETQNYFESRLRPGGPAISRIHATPGYPLSVAVGLTFNLWEK